MSQSSTFGSFPYDGPGWKSIRKEMEEDSVNSPPHYNRNDIESIEAIEASMSQVEFLGYLKGNIQKYLWRYSYKNKPIEDLKKAEWYLIKLIQECEKVDADNLINLFNGLETPIANLSKDC